MILHAICREEKREYVGNFHNRGGGGGGSPIFNAIVFSGAKNCDFLVKTKNVPEVLK